MTTRAPRADHQLLPYSMMGEVSGVSAEGLWHQLRDEVHSTSSSAVVLSAEAFSRLDHSQILFVRDQFANCDVQVLYYLRGLRQRIVSTYSYSVGLGRCGVSLARFINERSREVGRDGEALQLWASVFGKERIVVRPFEAVIRYGSLVNDFFQVLGVPHEQVRELSANSSPPAKTVQMLRWVNAVRSAVGIGPDNAVGRLSLRAGKSRLASRTVGAFFDGALYTPEVRELLRGQTASWYGRVVDTYVPAEHRHLYEL